jgi:hypothetical protein
VTPPPDWYVDTRPVESTEQLSLDLTRHLPQRLSVGSAVIVADRPAILLPVIRKRWMTIVREVERQRARTLDRTKRVSLERELTRLLALRFTTKIDKADTDVLVIKPEQTVCELPQHHTLYLATDITRDQFASALEYAVSGGVVVVYGDWQQYEPVLRGKHFVQYGQEAYPMSP